MKRKAIFYSVILLTIVLGYLLAQAGTFSPPNPPLHIKVFVIFILSCFISTITVVPCYLFYWCKARN